MPLWNWSKIQRVGIEVCRRVSGSKGERICVKPKAETTKTDFWRRGGGVPRQGAVPLGGKLNLRLRFSVGNFADSFFFFFTFAEHS